MSDYFMVTYSGRKIVIEDPDPTQITIEDIAHHLSLLCRFSGATEEFYSVAQHSCLVASIVPKHLRMQALLHDAAEAYIGDVIWPLKQLLPEYKRIEKRMMHAVFGAMGQGLSLLPEGLALAPEVLHADLVALATEKRDLIQSNVHIWQKLPPPLDRRIWPITSEEAEEAYLDFWRRLTKEVAS